jgi:hypothetical protein
MADDVPQGEGAPLDESLPLLPDEHEAPQFAMVRLVEVRPQGQKDASAWRDELQAGQSCPQCHRYKLKRQRSRVYCHFCRQAWWSRQPQWKDPL